MSRLFYIAIRFADPHNPMKVTRTRWTKPIEGWEFIDGRPLPTAAQTVWHMPEGPFVYADFHPIPGSLVFNVPAGA